MLMVPTVMFMIPIVQCTVMLRMSTLHDVQDAHSQAHDSPKYVRLMIRTVMLMIHTVMLRMSTFMCMIPMVMRIILKICTGWSAQ
jgi:hypothetical protein